MSKKYIPVILFLLILTLGICACGGDGEDREEEENEETFAYAYAVKEDNYMMGENYGDVTPRYVFGDIVAFDQNATQDIYLVNKACTDAAVSEYIALCADKGFAQVNETCLEDNRSISLSNGELIITIMDLPGIEKVIITVEKAETQIYKPLAAASASTDTAASISQIGSDNSADLYGMGYVIRLSDGRFIVIDGGYRDNSADDWIYNEMEEQTPEGEQIIIAAWIITHPHDDHCGAFISFTTHYKKKVTLERVFYNFASEHQYSTRSQNYDYDELVRTQAVEQNYPGIMTVNPHICSVYDFGRAKLTYIYTAEAMQGDAMASSNSMSTVFILELEGQKMLFLADSNTENVPYISKMYSAETLACDCLQLAHHGYNNLDFGTELYECVNPSFVFFPSSTENFECDHVQSGIANKWIFDAVPAERIYVAGESVTRLELPLK